MSLAVFTAEDGNGREFLGLMIQEGLTEIKLFLGYREQVKANVAGLTEMLSKTVEEMLSNPPKKRLQVVEGSVANGLRTTQGRFQPGTKPAG